MMIFVNVTSYYDDKRKSYQPRLSGQWEYRNLKWARRRVADLHRQLAEIGFYPAFKKVKSNRVHEVYFGPGMEVDITATSEQWTGETLDQEMWGMEEK